MREPGNHHALEILVNYWEIPASEMGARLDEYVRHGVTHLASFVPWQAVESDISHSLSRFILALTERKMTCSLVVGPEVGIHFPYLGIPKEVLQKEDACAKSATGENFYSFVPPVSFPLPSIHDPEFQKRFQSFLSRMDTLVGDLKRSQPEIQNSIHLILTGGFAKYYRQPAQASKRIFSGLNVDFSSSANLLFRQKTEEFYQQREFIERSVVAAQRWKTRDFEDINRRWFSQFSEELFRVRSTQWMRRKSVGVKLSHKEIITPEADPSLFYSQIFQRISGGPIDFDRVVALLDEVSTLASGSAGEAAPTVIHLSGLGGFSGLADAEKQFLILKSLLSVGSSGGSVWIDSDEWFSLSPGFRSRTESLARSMAQRDLEDLPPFFYLTAHLWSAPGLAWQAFRAVVGTRAKRTANFDYATSSEAQADGTQKSRSAWVMIDPSVIIQREMIRKIVRFVKEGGIVCLPKTPLYSDGAKTEFDLNLIGAKKTEFFRGVSAQMIQMGLGNLIWYDLPEGRAETQYELKHWVEFLTSIANLTDYEEVCHIEKERVTAVAFSSGPLTVEGNRSTGLFVLNSNREPESIQLQFPCEVTVGDLSVQLNRTELGMKGGEEISSSREFELQVPALGVIPLFVEGLDKLRSSRKVLLEAMQNRDRQPKGNGPELEENQTWN